MDLYVQILNTIKNAVINDDVNSFKTSYSLLKYVNESLDEETVIKYKQNAYENLGNVNLICLSSKVSAIKVLRHVLSNENNFCSLPHLIPKCNLLPESEDEECHNTIYYAIRSNKIEIPEILLEKWLNGYFQENPEGLDDLLSMALKDLTVRNVPLSEDMKNVIKRILVNLRLFHKNSAQGNKKGSSNDINMLKDATILRIDFVLENITYLLENYSKTEPNEEFLLSSKNIAKNIHMLKSCIICKDKVPFEEMEFCLTIFIRSCQNRFQKYALYHFVVNKDRLLTHLKNFSKFLNKLKDKIRIVNKSKHGKLFIEKVNGPKTITGIN